MGKSAFGCLALLLAAGCQADSTTWTDEFSFVWHGEHVSVYGYERAQADACGGSLSALDTHTASILEFFGADDSMHYDYRWMSTAFWEGRCRPGATACTAYGEPWTLDLPHMHETTHAALYAAWGDSCPSFLSEGLAEYFSDPRRTGTMLPDPSRVPEALTSAPVSGADDYNVAGHFTSFLIEEFGAEVIEDLCYAVPVYANTLDDWDNAFSQVLGLQLAEVLTKYEAYPLCTQQQYRARLWECQGEADVTYAGGDQETTFEVEVNCSDERMLGPMGNRAITTRRVWFPEDALAHIQVTETGIPGALAGVFMSQECAPCSAAPQVYQSDGLPPIYSFRAGMHEFIFFVPLDATVPLTVRIAPF
jgi:hypothetical protein